MTATTEDDSWPPEPSEVAAFRAHMMWLLLACITGDEDRVGTEGMRIINGGTPMTAYALCSMAASVGNALVHAHGREHAIDTISAQLAAAVLAANEDPQ